MKNQRGVLHRIVRVISDGQTPALGKPESRAGAQFAFGRRTVAQHGTFLFREKHKDRGGTQRADYPERGEIAERLHPVTCGGGLDGIDGGKHGLAETAQLLA